MELTKGSGGPLRSTQDDLAVVVASPPLLYSPPSIFLLLLTPHDNRPLTTRPSCPPVRIFSLHSIPYWDWNVVVMRKK